MRTATCTWDGEAWTNPAGEPCPDDHCAMRGRCPNHVRHAAGLMTCANCVRRVRRDISEIVTRYALLAYDARVDGVESEAMNLLGRAAAPEQYAERRARLAARYRRQGWCDWPRAEAFRADDPHHPYAVLGRWDLALREQGWLGRTDLLITVSSAADALTHALDHATPYGFPHGDEFEEFAREIADCLAHLEAVDQDDRQADLGRPCPTCVTEHGPDYPAPRLRKRYARHAWARPGQRCDDADCQACAGQLDAWHCPDFPAHAWTEADYRARVDADYVEHAAALTVSQLAAKHGIPASTIRRWCSEVNRRVGNQWKTYPPRLKPVGRDAAGRKLYSVQRVLELRKEASGGAA